MSLAPDNSLTSRQAEIVKLAAEGYSDQEISEKLGLSLHTVLSHWKNIRERFGNKNRAAVISNVLSRGSQLSEEDQLLLFQSAQIDKLNAELTQANAKLLAALAENQRLLSQQMSATAKLVNNTSAELEGLRQLDALLTKQTLVVHEGEYGASWRKTYMSGSVRAVGYTSEQWTNAEITVYDIMRPEDTARALQNLENMDGSRERCVIIYKALTADRKDLLLIDFIKMEPFDEDGVGRYHAFTFDITEWEHLLREALETGYPD